MIRSAVVHRKRSINNMTLHGRIPHDSIGAVCNGGDLLERVTVSRQRLPEQEAQPVSMLACLAPTKITISCGNPQMGKCICISCSTVSFDQTAPHEPHMTAVPQNDTMRQLVYPRGSVVWLPLASSTELLAGLEADLRVLTTWTCVSSLLSCFCSPACHSASDEVQHLHLTGVVHRDIKPENFLFTRRESDMCCLCIETE
eukprot:6303171-Amphidinium_carterae.1